MAFDMQELLRAARHTVQQPRSGARLILNLQLPVNVAWVSLALMAVASAALSTLTFMLSEAAGTAALDPAMTRLFANPMQFAALQAGVLLLGAMLMHAVGRMFGGRGQFNEALLLVAWLEFILLLLQIAQIVAMLVSASLAGALGVFGLVLFLWLLVNFIAELHGFASVLTVLFGVIGTFLVISIAMAVLIVAVVGVGA